MPERLRLKPRDFRGYTAIAAPGTGYYLYFESQGGGQIRHGVRGTWTALGVLREIDWLHRALGARRTWVVPA